jgi:hypothetical protein
MTLLELAAVAAFLLGDAAVGYLYFRWMRR